MKAIMMSIRPEWVAKILNGEKTIEIRKKFPKDYVGWVYIYCTKDKQLTLRNERYILIEGEKYHIDSPVLNGKVVARFWCDKVEEIETKYLGELETLTMNMPQLLNASCLSLKQLDNYLQDYDGRAIHITNLEIFDKPKEIKEFVRDTGRRMLVGNDLIPYCEPLIRAPQSWCHIEV